MADKQQVSKPRAWWEGVKAEWRKIIWPTRQDLAKKTGITERAIAARETDPAGKYREKDFSWHRHIGMSATPIPDMRIR